jgi:enterobactin synthetase component D
MMGHLDAAPALAAGPLTAWPGVSSPDVVPSCVRQHSVGLSGGDATADWPAAEIGAEPPELLRAVPRRRRQFRAGRLCAAAALRKLEPGLRDVTVGRDAGGAPLWPAGMTGSITHTDDFVSAAVARTREVWSLGIDSEHVIGAARANVVSTTIAWPCEQAHARQAGCDRLEALTLIFSAKEAIFKCLYPLVRQFFDFHDARIVDVDAGARTFTARLVKTLTADFAAGTILHGSFEIGAGLVHTGITIPAPPARR